MHSPRSAAAGRRKGGQLDVQAQALDVDTLRHEYSMMHDKNELPKRVVDVEVSPLTAPDAHTWLHVHEKEVARMRDIFGRKTNQPAPPQIVAYADARFCQMTAIPQLEIHGCSRETRRNGIVVARQLSKARRLNEKGKKSKKEDSQTSGAKMCENISNLLLSVGIHDEAELSELNKKLKLQKAKSRLALKTKAISAFGASTHAAARNPFDGGTLASASDKVKVDDALVERSNEGSQSTRTDTDTAESGKQGQEENQESNGHAEENKKVLSADKADGDEEEGGRDQDPDGDPEATTVKVEANDTSKGGFLHNVMHQMHLTDSTRHKEKVPALDLPVSVRREGGVTDSEDPNLASPSSLMPPARDSDDAEELTETEYAEVAYSSDESEEQDGLKGVDSDEEGDLATSLKGRRKSRKDTEANVLKKMKKALKRKGHDAEQELLSNAFKPHSLGGDGDGDGDGDDPRGGGAGGKGGDGDEAGKLVPHLDVFTMSEEDISWVEELAHLYLVAGMAEKIEQVGDILEANKGGELAFLEHLAEKYASVLPVEQRVRVQNLQFILKRPDKASIDLKQELEQLYDCLSKSDMKEGVDKVLALYHGRELELIETHFAEYTRMLPPDSQEIQRVECLRMMYLPPGQVPQPLNRGHQRKFKFGARKTRVHDVKHALYVKSDEIDWRGELTHLYLIIGKPDKIKELGQLLDEHKGCEIVLLERFQAKYGDRLPHDEAVRLRSLMFIYHKPRVAWSPGMVDWKGELATLYIAAGRSDKLDVLDDIVEANKGTEADLLVRLVDKYQEGLPPSLITRLRALKEIAARKENISRLKDVNWRAELSAFYLAIDKPEKLEFLDSILQENKGAEGDLFAHFCDKYRNEIPAELESHLLNLGQMVEQERLGQSFVDAFDELQLAGHQYDTNKSMHGLEAVHVIDLSLNRIRFLDFSRKMTWSVDHLVALNLSGNLLVSLRGIESCRHLRFLNCSDNLLTDMYALRGCLKLRHLKISGNRLVSVSFLSPAELAVADDPEEHSKMMLSNRRGTKGAFRSQRATSFFHAKFGDGKTEGEALRRRGSVISPRASPRLLQAMLNAAKGNHDQEGFSRSGAGDKSDYAFYDEPGDIQWDRELSIFYMAAGLDDKLPKIPVILTAHSTLESRGQMARILLDKYRPVPVPGGGGAESGGGGEEGPGEGEAGAGGVGHLAPPDSLDRLAQLAALADPPHVYENADDIDWAEELQAFYHAAGLHAKVPLVDKILKGHAHAEDHMVDVILGKYDGGEGEGANVEGGAGDVDSVGDTSKGEGDGGSGSGKVRIPKCARRRLLALRDQFRTHLEERRAAREKESADATAAAAADTAAGKDNASRRSGFFGSFRFGRDSKRKDDKEFVDSPEPSPRPVGTTKLASSAASSMPEGDSVKDAEAPDDQVVSPSALAASYSASTLSSSSSAPSLGGDDPVPPSQVQGSRKMTRFADNVSVGEAPSTEAGLAPSGSNTSAFGAGFSEFLHGSNGAGTGAEETSAEKKIFELPHLEYLNASENSTLESLHGLRYYSHLSLMHLELRQCNLSDAHLQELVDLPLRTLHLDNNHITSLEESLPSLKTLGSLKNLSLMGNPVQLGAGASSGGGGGAKGGESGETNSDVVRAQDKRQAAHGFAAKLVKEGSMLDALTGGGGEASATATATATATASDSPETGGQSLHTTAQKKPPPVPTRENSGVSFGEPASGQGQPFRQDSGKEGKKGGILRKESSQASQASSASSEGSQGQGQGQKSLYSIAILDSIDTLETLDHLAIPPMLYHQLRRLKARVEGEAVLTDIERYYNTEMLSMEDVHKNLAQKHRRSESLIKAIVKDKTVRVEEEMSALLKYARAKLLTLRSTSTGKGGDGYFDFNSDSAVNPQEVLSTVKGEFASKKRLREAEKKAAEQRRLQREQEELEKKQRALKAVVPNPHKTSPRRESVLLSGV